jgi:hypothetical protein
MMRMQDKNNDGETYGLLPGFTFVWSFEATQGPEDFARPLLLARLMISHCDDREGDALDQRCGLARRAVVAPKGDLSPKR